MNLRNNNLFLKNAAIEVLKGASGNDGIKASSEETDNYNRIWARDSAVSSLAILTNQIKHLYPNIKASIVTLQNAANSNGQIPSNVSTDESETIKGVSFGGPVGRTDTSFWWLIMSISYLQQQEDLSLKSIVYEQAKKIFQLANSWEFNGKNLMYVPMSSNWADEYVTHGYVLYDQILRYWAQDLAGDYFNQEDWKIKAAIIKTAIKQHYLFEADLKNSLYTVAQHNQLQDFDLEHQFIASFSPGDRIERFDAWSVALLCILNIPSQKSAKKLEKAILNIFEESNQKGIPAFYPFINETDKLADFLKLNHHYRFKNHPGHFHNGGIWPVVNGFLIAGLQTAGFNKTAKLLMDALENNLQSTVVDYPFAEYFDFNEGHPNGVKNLCYSASGYLIAQQALNHQKDFRSYLFPNQQDEDKILEIINHQTQNVIHKLALNTNNKYAISISGESGCGKTTLAKSIHKQLESTGWKVLVLHQDEYFKLPPKQNHDARLVDLNHIGPQEVRLPLLNEHIVNIKAGEHNFLNVPRMDWDSDTEQIKQLDIKNVDLIIVEGTYTSLLKNVDKRIFIDTNYQATRQNRVNRNRETVTEFIERVLQKESEIIQKHKELADLVLDQNLNIINK